MNKIVTAVSTTAEVREDFEAIARALAIVGQRDARFQPLVNWLAAHRGEVIEALRPVREAELLRPLREAEEER